jgi:hypothetical protein
MQDMTRKERKAAITAYHEAGHAVAHVMLGEDFDYVTIVPNDDSAGYIEMTRPADIVEAWQNGDRLDNARVTQYTEHELIGILAGSEAQRLFFPRCQWRAGHGIVEAVDLTLPHGLGVKPKPNMTIMTDGGDAQNAWRLVLDLHDGDADVAREHYVYLGFRTRALVRAHRDKIDRVAQALLKHKTLSADQARTAMFPEFAKVVA